MTLYGKTYTRLIAQNLGDFLDFLQKLFKLFKNILHYTTRII